ncbi:hypothetical protein RJ639_043906 [Escallonia herrerae]|uniref:RING-type E3 ubiquitin transferase n=1 Tax=Escallonia herrerae TaxID=1293975 RepID=A0AA89B182_9ASTE|nr:hypothetical protein RJ639_043906 [Escallonia herrerae]
MVVAIIVLFVVVVFVFFLHLYAKWFWYRRQDDADPDAAPIRRRRRFDFSPGHQELSAATVLRRGLDPSVLKSIPILAFSQEHFKDGLECAVCLSEVLKGEKARVLPNCDHGFHVDCIDMWFQSHSTCPLCRDPVSSSASKTGNSEVTLEAILQTPAEQNLGAPESLNFPTNVLFWGNETRVRTLESCLEETHQQNPGLLTQPGSSSSSSGSTSNRQDGALVIDIPRQIYEEEDQKSPMPSRMRSLKRLLSKGRRANPVSPSNVDVEQLGRGQS